MHSLLIAASMVGSLLAGVAFAQAPATTTLTKPPASAPNVTAPAPTAKTTATLIDVNSATVAEMQALKGVGPTRAEAIVNGRPYKRKDDLTRKNILPKNVYDEIKEQIVARQK